MSRKTVRLNRDYNSSVMKHLFHQMVPSRIEGGDELLEWETKEEFPVTNFDLDSFYPFLQRYQQVRFTLMFGGLRDQEESLQEAVFVLERTMKYETGRDVQIIQRLNAFLQACMLQNADGTYPSVDLYTSNSRYNKETKDERLYVCTGEPGVKHGMFYSHFDFIVEHDPRAVLDVYEKYVTVELLSGAIRITAAPRMLCAPLQQVVNVFPVRISFVDKKKGFVIQDGLGVWKLVVSRPVTIGHVKSLVALKKLPAHILDPMENFLKKDEAYPGNKQTLQFPFYSPVNVFDAPPQIHESLREAEEPSVVKKSRRLGG